MSRYEGGMSDTQVSEIVADAPPAARPSQREGQRVATRGRIIDAAIEVFAARGFDGTALPVVAELAEVRVSLIIYHFATKEGLWRASVAEIYDRVSAHIDGYMDAILAAEGMDFFRLSVRAHITAAARHPEYHRILFQEAMQKSERLRWLVETHQRPMTDRIIAVIERAQAEGVLPADMSPMHLKYLTSGMFTLPITLAPEYELFTGEDATADAFIERHIDACLELLARG